MRRRTPSRSSLVPALLAAAAAPVVLAAPVLAAPMLAAPVRAETPAGVRVDRVVRDARLTEASGLAVDPYRGDVIWTQNDSGNAPELFALAADGRTRARVTVKGIGDDDWEALQSWRAPGGQGLIVIGDIGDNRAGRESVRLVAVPVGPGTGHVTTAPDAVITLSYPDGPHDAEAFLLDPRDGRGYVVTKGLFTGTLYAVPPGVWTARAWRPGAPFQRRRGTLTRLADIPMSLVTDGAVLGDGRIVLRNYGEVKVFAPAAGLTTGMADELAEADLPEQEQGEGLTVVAGAGGRAELLIGSEGKQQPLLRVPVPGKRPAPPPAVATRPEPPSRGGSRRPSAPAAAAPAPDTELTPPARDRSGLVAPAVITAVVVGGYWYARRRRK